MRPADGLVNEGADLKDLTFSEDGPRAWFAVIRRKEYDERHMASAGHSPDTLRATIRRRAGA